MVFWSLAVQSIKFVSWLNFSEMGGSIFPDCWFSQAVISRVKPLPDLAQGTSASLTLCCSHSMRGTLAWM